MRAFRTGHYTNKRAKDGAPLRSSFFLWQFKRQCEIKEQNYMGVVNNGVGT